MNEFQVNKSTIEIIRGDVEIPDKVRQRVDDTLAGLGESKAPRKRRFTRAAAIVAACLLAVPSVAFAAYISGENSAFYQAIFGDNSRPSIQQRVEYDEDGKMSLNLPNMQRVDVDEEQAEALLGGNIKQGESYQLKGYRGDETTLTIHNVLFDEKTGIFQAYISLEKAGGVDGLVICDYGECYFSGEGMVIGGMAPGRMYYDKDNSTKDKVYITAVGVSYYGDTVMQFGEYIPMAEVKPEDVDKADSDLGMYYNLMDVDFASLASSIGSVQVAEGITVNPLGMRLDLPALGFKDAVDDYALQYIAIEYKDGESYIIRDRAANLENWDYAITVGPQDEGDASNAITTYCFNRLVDTDNVKSVTINDKVYDLQ